MAEKLKGMLTLKWNDFFSSVPLKLNSILILVEDFVNPDDPTFIAENELLNAANAIEAAAKTISALKPRENNVVSD